MIQLQPSPFSRHETGRILPPPGHSQQDRLRLEGLADAAVCLQEPAVYSPDSPPTSPFFQEYTFRHSTTASDESKPYNIPSIQSLFAIADGDRPRSYGFDPPGLEPSFRRPSTGSEASFQGSFTSMPELSRLSTASPPPTLAPRTPEAHHTIAPETHLKIELRLSDLADQLKRLEQANKRLSLQPARGRRPSSRQAPYSTAGSDKDRRGSSTSSKGGQSGAAPKGKGQPKKPHFNLRYPKSVKLFILYHKEDCGWGWKAINERRVGLLPVLYRGGYKPEIEENREVAGINGFYYRLNEVMPALTPDGSGLRFVEQGGRTWELTEPCKCREGPARGGERRKGCGGGGRASKASKDKDDAEAARPRGMVARYPEEVVYYWDEFVKHFVPQARHAEVYARAKRYCEIRAEQRRQKGVPQWTPDNEEDRVWHTKPPNSKSKMPRAKAGEADETLPELMRACELDAKMEVD
ncbi:hypothetical protein KVR01_013505 [Diaporthe batatas]|uniref:uncharacterized protein n=1 Tax=Diaporthe batatas TaxID=748121 RepID=UPI001D057530|nr:uncharacterized protein KVR01_013505 [Diaporthe batatas]KAG8156714.1 hypothetical protein KVR01_013505 [Diaporthe batatas]